MKKIIIIPLLLFTITVHAQMTEQIDCVKLINVTGDSLEFEVHSTINGGVFGSNDFAIIEKVEYVEEYDTIKMTILYSQEELMDCYCPMVTSIKIKKGAYINAVVEVKARRKIGGTSEYSYHRRVGIKTIDLSNIVKINSQIDSVNLVDITSDSLIFAVYSTLNNGVSGCVVEYVPENETIKVNILYGLWYNDPDCSCSLRETIKIKKDIYKKAVVEVKHRHNMNDYNSVDIKEIDLANITNIDNPTLPNKISIFPNSVQNVLYINLGENKTMNFELYNIQGILLLSKSIITEANVDISFLSSGLYFIVVDKKYVYKIIKH